MKIAILLTGQLRTWNLCKYIIKNIQESYDTDIFLSVDLCNLEQHEYKNSTEETSKIILQEAIDFYKPTLYYYNDNYDDTDFNNIIQNTNYEFQEKISMSESEIASHTFSTGKYLKFKHLYKKNLSKNKEIHSVNKINLKKLSQQYFYVFKAYELLEKHITDKKEKYDAVLRLRFDQLIWNQEFYFSSSDIIPNDENIEIIKNKLNHIKLQVDIPKSNEICVLGGGVFYNYGYVNDQFWVHHQNNIEEMKLFYKFLPYIIQNSINNFWPCHGCWIEHFFAVYLFNQNITIKRSLLNGIYIREKR